ncbi:hypothetical protein [Aeromonas hydrophila]|uniref:hypothetical protein n=1 Tax=Aeromonas hydrophila TaxID=644 RepID=UPI001FC88009|nr:hypothetical protein [Aeromonas hydrophila]GKQ99781.1 hypothetical protein KAM461_40310 [Aeromonas hydrophila]
MEETSFEEKRKDLEGHIVGYMNFKWKLYSRNYWLNCFLVVFAILTSVSVTLVGLLGLEKYSPYIGIVLTVTISMQTAFNFSERADFYLNIHTQAKSLRDRIKFNVKTEKELENVVDILSQLRMKASSEIPKGKGMKVVSDSNA